MKKAENKENFNGSFYNEKYFFGKERSNYDDYRKWDNDKFWRSTIDDIRKYRMSGNALEIGCAFGYLLKRIAPYFREIHGVDISGYALKYAKKEVPGAILHKIDIQGGVLPYEDSYFDLIIAYDVLEHTDSIENSLHKIVPKLKKNGYLMLSLPVKDTWAGKIFNKLDKDPTHQSILESAEILRIIEGAELKTIKKNYFFNIGYMKVRGIPVDIELLLKREN
jgi:SAM-dependent methyltransferase